MANSTRERESENFKLCNMRRFPSVIDNKINVLSFLHATSDLLKLLDNLGSLFAPVKYDMQGNMDKIIKHYTYDEDSCLLALMLDEKNRGRHDGAEGVLWLNRALHFFEIVFQEIVDCLNRNDYDANMANIFTIAYNGSIKKYHNWVTKKIALLILKMAPSMSQILKTLDPTQNMASTETHLTELHLSLKAVVSRIDLFFEENHLFMDK